jgi:peroxiredoxin
MPESRSRLILRSALVWMALAAQVGVALAQESASDHSQAPEQVDTPATEEPAAREHVIVEGQVTDHIGAGHAGVTVTVRRKAEGGGEGELIATATTDELGDFKVTAPEPVHGEIVVTLSKPMYTPIVRELHVGDSEWPEFVAEQFEGNLVVIGRVTDALTDEPIVGASVTLEASYNEWYATTDQHGQFTIKGISPGRGDLIIEKDGYGREKQPVRELEDFGEIPVRLKPERVVRLRTLDDLGKPIAGVTVECYDEPRDDFKTLVTDKDGSITVRGIHFDAAVLTLRLTHESYVSSEGFDRKIITPEDKTESTHDLVMERAGTITGRVTSARSSGPLHGARIMTGTDCSDDSPRDWTDYEGNYAIRGVRPGSVIVTIHLSGYAPELKSVEVQAGETARLDVELRKGAVLEGIVKTESGKPVSGAFVDATQWRGAGTLGLRAVTNDEGKFVIENAPYDTFELTVTARDMGRVVSMVKADGDEPLSFTVPDTPVSIGSDGRAVLRVGETAPPLSMTTLDGKPLKLSDFKGKTVLLDFRATWCGPCIAELPHLVKVHERFGRRKDFVIITVSLDSDEEALRGFLEKHEMPWYHVFGEAGGAQTAAERFGVNAIPAAFIIEPTGKVVASGVRGADIVRKVERVLQDNDPT